MGSRSDNQYAYIAGFLDGDGSLMLQIKKRKDGRIKLRLMSTICLYQDSRHEADLRWIRKILKIGYLSRRNDGISELRINGFAQTKRILEQLMPYIRFKRHQAKSLYQAVNLLNNRDILHLTKRDRQKLVRSIMTIQEHNYVTRHKRSEAELRELLDLTP